MKLDLYVLRQILAAFLLAVGGMLFLALPGIAVSTVHKLAGVDTAILLRYLPLPTLALIPFVLPIGFLLAIVATYGRLAADNEWTAIRMAGIHPLRVLGGPAAAALVLGAATWWLVSDPLPRLHRHQRQFMVDAAIEVIRNLSPGRTELQIGPFYVSGHSRDGNAFLDALIYIPRRVGPARELVARRVELDCSEEELVIRLEDWRSFVRDTRVESASTVVRVPLAELIDDNPRRFHRPRYLTSAELRERLASGELDAETTLDFAYERHDRLAHGATFLLFLLLGAPTGLVLRRGTQLAALAVAVGYAIAYYVLSLRIGKMLGGGGTVPPGVAAWATTVLGTLYGALLARKAFRE